MPQAIGLAIGQVLFSLGAPLALVNFFAIGIGGTIIAGLALFGVQALLAPKRPQITPSDGQQNIRQDLPFRTRSFGQVRVGGFVWWFASAAGRFYLGLTVNHGRIAEYLEFFLDDAEVVPNGAGIVTATPFSSNVTIKTRLGATSELKYSEILSAFGVDEARGDGVATALAMYQGVAADSFRSLYPTGGPPQLRVTIKASVCWDPRDPGQDREDATTWEWSENPIVCLLTYELDPDGAGTPWELIEPAIADWIAAADVCDEDVPLKGGGTEKRYRVAGTYSLADEPKNVRANFLRICDGWYSERLDGSITVKAGAFEEPTVTIPSEHILAYQFTAGQDRLTAIAGIRGSFLSTVHDYRSVEADPWPNGDAVIEVGEDRTAQLNLDWSPSHGQARRLMKRSYIRATTPWQGTIRTNLAGLLVFNEQRFARFQIDEIGIDLSFEITKATLDLAAMECEFDVTAIDATIDDWDPDTEEGTPPEDPAAIEASGQSAPTGVGVTWDTGVATVHWDAAPAFSHVLNYKPTAGSTWSSVSAAAGLNDVATPTLTVGVSYDFRVRAVGGTGTASPWSAIVTSVAA